MCLRLRGESGTFDQRENIVQPRQGLDIVAAQAAISFAPLVRISLSKEAKIRISQSMGNVWPWYAGNDIQPLAGLNDIFACGKNDITAAPQRYPHRWCEREVALPRRAAPGLVRPTGEYRPAPSGSGYRCSASCNIVRAVGANIVIQRGKDKDFPINGKCLAVVCRERYSAPGGAERYFCLRQKRYYGCAVTISAPLVRTGG